MVEEERQLFYSIVHKDGESVSINFTFIFHSFFIHFSFIFHSVSFKFHYIFISEISYYKICVKLIFLWFVIWENVAPILLRKLSVTDPFDARCTTPTCS